MKRIIRASIADEQALKEAQDIYKKAEALLSVLDSASDMIIEKFELYDLYERLREDVPAMGMELRSTSKKSVSKPKYEDMW